jgi:hypothetical protein
LRRARRCSLASSSLVVSQVAAALSGDAGRPVFTE